MSLHRPTALGVICTTAVMMAAVFWSAQVAHAAESRVFNPTLSLTGSCITEPLDPVPDPWCPGPPKPSLQFEYPNIAIDSYGDMYVTSSTRGFGSNSRQNGRIYVFGPEGEFITEFPVAGPNVMAIDSDGNLYVREYVASAINGVNQISRFSPSTYQPAAGEIEYGNPGTVIVEETTDEFGFLGPGTGVAVDPTTGRLFVTNGGGKLGEWSSASEGNELLDSSIGQGVLSNLSKFLAVDAAHNRLYVADSKPESDASFIRAFELEPPHAFLGVIDGSDTPAGKFLSDQGYLTVDVDEATGHVFVSDIAGSSKVYEFTGDLEEDEDEEYLGTYEHSFKEVFVGEVAIDNSPTSPNRGTLYVPSSGTIDHTYAFKFAKENLPLVEPVSVEGVTATEAVLAATINPEGAETTYRFEYLTEEEFDEHEFEGAATTATGVISAGVQGVEVSAPVEGLAPGAAYRFRAVAVNSVGEDELEGRFRTYPAPPSPLSCPNDAFRSGLSSRLPDCRAYELVTPPDTNGYAPVGIGDTGVYFPSLESAADGSKATFRIRGASLPGSEGAGSFNGENYLTVRGANGWSTQIIAPSGSEEVTPVPGGVSPDQEHAIWGGEIEDEPASNAVHVRYPDGHSDLLARGSLGTQPKVDVGLISEGGAHMIFATVNGTEHPAEPLEPNAPPKGTPAVYDRTPEGTHVVSLLPGNVTQSAAQGARYVGASYDGNGVAFAIAETLFLRYRNEATYEVGTGVTFAGVSEGGGRLFYLEGGDLFAFDVPSESAIPFSSSGNVTPVNVAPDGTAAYFLSPSKLTSAPNPNGLVAKAGNNNLYRSDEGDISFVGPVEPLDVVGPPLPNGDVAGLGLWVKSLAAGRPGIETSRTTPNGSTLLFESRADLAGYEPKGHVEIYLYNTEAGSLACLSCNPTEASAGGDASLQTIGIDSVEAPVSTLARVPNLRPSGNRAFFESSEPLVVGDTDGVQDVYEWEAQGVGSCDRPDGCVQLISSGESARKNYLYSVSESGDDVFFLTSDILLPADHDQTPSIYDARVNGGFAEPLSVPCSGEGCNPVSPVPGLTTPVTGALGPNGNLRKARRCAKGRVKRHGKCVKKHHPKRNRSNKKRKGAHR